MTAIRSLRLKLGLNQTEFWRLVGVTQSGGSRYESGQRRIPKAVRVLLNSAYGDGSQLRAMVARAKRLLMRELRTLRAKKGRRA
jgi:transcriptional regulator with XRE-family HTH domain